MAKNFTDFQELTGEYIAPINIDGVTTGTTTTQTTTGMYLVGYDIDQPDGEKRYTVESVLLAADKYHVGLENVDNISSLQLLDNTTLTGETSADNLFIHGNLTVEGSTTQLNTNNIATSSFDITNYGTDIGLEVKQYGPTHSVSRFYNGDDLTLDISQHGTVGIGVVGDDDTTLTVMGDVSAVGEIFTTGAVNGRYMQQDGLKLDNIAPWADVTSEVLGSLQSHMEFLKANAPEYSAIEPAKAFDLIEDGDNFTKTPSMTAVEAPGIGDISTQKLASVEYHSDKTGDHSADIIFNDVPDGPFTGDVLTTFVKITSAEHDRLNAIRGVELNLYNGDDDQDITSNHIRDAYHSAYPSYWSTEDELEYRGTIIPDLYDTRTNVSDISARRDQVIIKVENDSANWDSTHNSLFSFSGDWDSTYGSVLATSSIWDSTYTSVSETSGTWNSTHTSVNTSSGSWDQVYTTVNETSSSWVETATMVADNNVEWTSSVNNKLDDQGNFEALQPGHADLHTVVTEGLTATSTSHLGNEVYVLSAGEWKKGVTADVPQGQDILRFVDGILVDWIQ